LTIQDPTASGVVRLVKCWLPVGKTSGALRTQDLWLYAHRICAETDKVDPTQESLF